MTDRDTHFQDFAKLLWDELMMAHGSSYGYIDVANDGLDADLITDYQQIIAQRVYDLAYHVLLQVDLDDDYYSRFEYDTKRIVNSIPDLIQWPESLTPRLLDRSTWPKSPESPDSE